MCEQEWSKSSPNFLDLKYLSGSVRFGGLKDPLDILGQFALKRNTVRVAQTLILSLRGSTPFLLYEQFNNCFVQDDFDEISLRVPSIDNPQVEKSELQFSRQATRLEAIRR
jgi:hypothetical protein